jgi:TetR/AcrR family transcriptional regulator, transcriptional repressor for nem operon
MRYPPDYKANARARLLETAAALAKEKGFGTTGVDALMAAAGMTSGAFYSHFKSKPELLKAIIEHELAHTTALFTGKDTAALRKAFRSYLSEQHVAHPESGCPLPALTPEVARADAATREVFEQQLVQAKDQLQAQLSDDGHAWAVIAQVVGAVMLARAMASPEARKALLQDVRQSVDALLVTQE